MRSAASSGCSSGISPSWRKRRSRTDRSSFRRFRCRAPPTARRAARHSEKRAAMQRSSRSTTPGQARAQILSFRKGPKRPIPTVDLGAVHEAQVRLRPYVRRTPIMQAWLPSMPGGATVPLHLKLETLQIAGGADVRGVLNFALSLPSEQLARGLVTASWGNVGSAVAYVGHLLGIRTTVYMVRPFASSEMIAAIERWGAEVVVQGTTWDATERIA